MNDKIKLIAEQSGLDLTQQLETFARNVAKECAFICESESHAHRMGFGFHCSETIKSQFHIYK